jgi:hypothetical protein
LSGNALDKTSVMPQAGGFYDSGNNKIIWDKDGEPRLEFLAPGDKGVVSFTFASLAQINNFSKNQQINIDTTIYGVPQGGSNTI